MKSKTTIPLRIALLGYRSNPHCGGQGGYIRNLSKALCSLGHRVDVISGPQYPVVDTPVKLIRIPGLDLYNPNDLFRLPRPSELTSLANLIEWIGVSTMGFPEPFTFGLRVLQYLKKNRKRYDVIHDNQSLCYGIWSAGKNIPLVTTIHHPITVDRRIAIKTEKILWRKLKELRWYSFLNMQKQVARRLKHVITVSKSAMNDIADEFRIPQNRFTVIPNGINTDLFYPINGVEREKNRIIVTNSSDTPLKGLAYLLEAVYKIAGKRKIKVVVIGTPKKNGQIIRMIKRLSLENIVKFTGRITHEEFVVQYAKASMAVIPSIYEGFGLPAGEAMACRVPVISTTGGALPEVVGDAGILVPPADSHALQVAIERLLDNHDLARSLGEKGYERVRKHLTWEAAAKKTVEVYRKAIDAHH